MSIPVEPMTVEQRRQQLRGWAALSGDISEVGYMMKSVGLMYLEMEIFLEQLGKRDIAGDIRDFQIKFHQGWDGPPRLLPKEFYWRIEHMQEELNEFKMAVVTGDIVKQVDGLFDLWFLTMGTMHIQGFPIFQIWKEGWESNMSKEYLEKSGRFGAGVCKGLSYHPPDFHKILRIPKPEPKKP